MYRAKLSSQEVAELVSARKRVAVERALQSAFLRDRLGKINLDRLDEPEEWGRIPLLHKEELRELSTQTFYSDFCIADPATAVEFWRSGGATGKPLFYPRSKADIAFAVDVAFRRLWPCIGATATDTLHISFPLGIHPVGQLAARSAELEGIGTIWAGAGTTTPSRQQIQLIQELRPTILAAMPSYAIHLANLANAEGIDMAESSVKKLLVSAEPLTSSKREKLQRQWGATVYNSFGLTEGGMAAAEHEPGAGMVAWNDLYFMEVVDKESGLPLAEGETGVLVITPLWSNTITPFLRWVTGDLVSLCRQEPDANPWSIYPLLQHAHRTVGFFKIRGININHSDLEDFMFSRYEVADFKVEVISSEGNDVLRLLVEPVSNAEPGRTTAVLIREIKNKFELRPEIEITAPGQLALDFEKHTKAPRFVDLRT